MRSEGYRELSRWLFSEVSPDLQVTQRKLVVATGVIVTAGAGGTDTNLLISPNMPDVLQPGDGLMLDWWTVLFQPTLATVIPGAVVAMLRIQPNIPLTVVLVDTARETYQGTNTVSPGGLFFGFKFRRMLLTSFDIQRMLGGAGALSVSSQPLRFVVGMSDADSGAAQNVNWRMTVQYRLVRGLQEN